MKGDKYGSTEWGNIFPTTHLIEEQYSKYKRTKEIRYKETNNQLKNRVQIETEFTQ